MNVGRNKETFLMNVQVDMRPMKERQRELEERITKECPPQVADAVRKVLSEDSLKWSILPLVMKRELWELFWSVYRDSVEEQANRMLTLSERSKDEKPPMFGGFQT